MFIKKFILLNAIIILSACSSKTQNTSGQEYLEKHDTVGASAFTEGQDFEDSLRKIAAVEPTLKFPARIGLAKIEKNQISHIYKEEQNIWMALKDNLGENFGEFVLVNTLVAQMVSNEVKTKDTIITPMNQLRLAAARQHLDAILVYEIKTESSSRDNFLEAGNLTIIGSYILPSETVEAEGYARAVLVDVIQGYPYGTADIFLEKRKGYATNSEGHVHAREMEQEIRTNAAEKLAPEVEKMLKQVRDDLENRKTENTKKK